MDEPLDALPTAADVPAIVRGVQPGVAKTSLVPYTSAFFDAY